MQNERRRKIFQYYTQQLREHMIQNLMNQYLKMIAYQSSKMNKSKNMNKHIIEGRKKNLNSKINN
ncbi:unnamed protein product [Paramecium octaurelia]|uniref:Uncharacterized protein n=1 Tax=Paramecium octaurelia TaxID=43137 RepID=A0A8S1V0Z3_PAROT|nr:unnamed protein product [Paramecium octaurelia]